MIVKIVKVRKKERKTMMLDSYPLEFPEEIKKRKEKKRKEKKRKEKKRKEKKRKEKKTTSLPSKMIIPWLLLAMQMF